MNIGHPTYATLSRLGHAMLDSSIRRVQADLILGSSGRRLQNETHTHTHTFDAYTHRHVWHGVLQCSDRRYCGPTPDLAENNFRNVFCRAQLLGQKAKPKQLWDLCGDPEAIHSRPTDLRNQPSVNTALGPSLNQSLAKGSPNQSVIAFVETTTDQRNSGTWVSGP